MSSDRHAHALQKPDTHRRQGDERKERVAHEVEQHVMKNPRHGVDRVVAPLERPYTRGKHEVENRHDVLALQEVHRRHEPFFGNAG